MKKFLLTIVLLVVPIIVINTIVGLIRLKITCDDAIPIEINKGAQYFTKNEQLGYKNGIFILNNKHFDLSKEIYKKTLVKKYDAFGFSNLYPNKNPNVLIIGDSFFADPFIDTKNGLQAKINNSYNLAGPGLSGFKVFNELKKLLHS